MPLELKFEQNDDVSRNLVKIPEKRWSLVQTRCRNEKYTARNCIEQGIITYLPLLTKIEVHNRSKREFFLPMFPGYLFACPSREEMTFIRRDRGVWNLRVLTDLEEDELLRDLKIVRESELLSKSHRLVAHQEIHVGDTVRMKSGPFKNEEVIVVKRENELELIVNLNFLGRSISIRCSADEVKY